MSTHLVLAADDIASAEAQGLVEPWGRSSGSLRLLATRGRARCATVSWSCH